MPRVKWDQPGEKLYETGVDQCVLYPYNTALGAYNKGVAWNGITSISSSPEGAEPTDLWADNIKYLSILSTETYKGTIEAYTYPDEFAILDGSAALATGVMIEQQKRGLFGYCFRSLIGNDTEFNDHGYKLHLVYGAMASPSEKQHSTVNDSPEANTFSWSISTTPVPVTGFKPTSHLVIDSLKVDPDKLTALLDILYGTDGTGGVGGTDARLPLPDEIKTLMS